MVAKDFSYETLHPAEEPFWLITSPNADEDTVFLVDSHALRKLHEQIGLEIAAWDRHLGVTRGPPR
jgi:hypothetical protein